MRSLSFTGYVLSAAVAATSLAACAGSQPPISATSGLLSAGLPAYRARPDSRSLGFGTIFAMTRSGKETVLYRFHGSPDGANPSADPIEVNGTLYGTTTSGGTNNMGTVFAVTASGSETVLHSFAGGSGDGSDPVGGLVEVNGTLYGTTRHGGAYDKGTVFSITPSGALTVLHSFEGVFYGGPDDGQAPTATLLNVKGTLYGTTQFGGSGLCGGETSGSQESGCGTVFKITTSGEETVLHSFDGTHGWRPYGGLTNVNGTLYGTTVWSPQGEGHGIVFRISTSGKESTVYTFQGYPGDGADSYAGLINVNGTLYGTTLKGGAQNLGTLFSVTTSGAETMLHSFGIGQDGFEPYGGLVNVMGRLYGTTEAGGAKTGGVVFTATASGGYRVLHTFRGSPEHKGRRPYAGLINVNGRLYGTTQYGG